MPKPRSDELKIRIERSGDIIGLHHLDMAHTQEGIALVLNAGLIPELKGPDEVAIGRKNHPDALLAQSVDADDLLTALEADVLVASTMLPKEKISAVRHEASKLGKTVSIIVGIDPTSLNAMEQINLAVTNGADGIKFKPAGREAAKTIECIEYTKKFYPELLLLVAGGVKENNRANFAAKAGMGADTLAEIHVVTSWAKKSTSSHLDMPNISASRGSFFHNDSKDIQSTPEQQKQEDVEDKHEEGGPSSPS